MKKKTIHEVALELAAYRIFKHECDNVRFGCFATGNVDCQRKKYADKSCREIIAEHFLAKAKAMKGRK